ncbi:MULTISPECIES: DedA family protein [unclassified Paludibacterium]|uniref:DedA family protein n=1 Tax=unclassified Paludibacterium TaxID=2618429 RepID=UPI001C042684|nr:DedA family protein [Paludibacterium sp. B53371]BEV71598.1 DedA family protein [Paludibacterium sp. THUN1379]
MQYVTFLIDFILHIDQHLPPLIAAYGQLIYLILFAIVFSETGLVVTPFLPGDSLLFVAGTLAATGDMSLATLMVVLAIAAILGNQVNYLIGRFFGHKLFANPNSKIFRREYLDRTHAFYDKHGGKTLIFARFMPIIRTFAPFVAGIGEMPLLRFSLFNLAGSLLWVGLFCGAGYLFGNIPLIRKNLELLILGIIVLSFLPAIIGYLRHRKGQ